MQWNNFYVIIYYWTSCEHESLCYKYVHVWTKSCFQSKELLALSSCSTTRQPMNYSWHHLTILQFWSYFSFLYHYRPLILTNHVKNSWLKDINIECILTFKFTGKIRNRICTYALLQLMFSRKPHDLQFLISIVKMGSCWQQVYANISNNA